MALRTKQRHGDCPLCGERVLFARSSKGLLEAFTAEPTDEGYVMVSEGFSHIYESRVAAIVNLGYRQGWIAMGFKPQEMLREPHYCDLSDLYARPEPAG